MVYGDGGKGEMETSDSTQMKKKKAHTWEMSTHSYGVLFSS